MTPIRRASLDIGSNSVRTMVMEWTAARPLLLHDHGSMARIGDCVSTGGRLEGPLLQRAVTAVHQGAEAARDWGAHLSAFATAGLRDAGNRPEALRALSAAARAPIALVTGEQEAILNFAGVRASVPEPVEGEVLLIVDTGGGSTEVAWGGDRLDGSLSMPMGARKLLADCPALASSEPPDRGALDDAVAWARDRLTALEEAQVNLAPGLRAVGVGGTVTSLTALQLGLTSYEPMRVHGTVLSLGDLEGLAQRLRSVDKAERGRLLGEPARADLILPGWAIVTAVLERLSIDRIETNIFGPRLGILTESGGAIIANRLGEVE
ncbi:MAG: hypothetical protein GF320_08395 [Armatimonadia bacterium]|nr:hypothetical protein [Armatimonadia bacterium]